MPDPKPDPKRHLEAPPVHHGADLRLGGLTVQARVVLVLASMTVLVLVGALVTGVLLDRTSRATDRLTERIDPGRSEALRLQAALLDQETGVRGYAGTTDRGFLLPYELGQEAERRSTAALAGLLRDDPGLTADLEGLRQAAARWRATYADPLIAAIRTGNASATTMAESGKASFDQVRTLFTAQNASLQAAHDRAKTDLERTEAVRDQVLLAMLAAFLLTGVALTLMLRHTVVRPLQVLAAAARDVAAGDFDRHIPMYGPGDVRRVANDVESMREHIVAELVIARRQRQELDDRARELARSNADLEQFAYVASHDLQEPLRKVASFCQMLEQRYGDKLDDRAGQYIHFAVDGAKRMQSLINDLLTFSRLGRPEHTHRRRLSLDLPLDAALANLAAAVDETGAVVRRPARLPDVDGDGSQLTMLWQNLVGNAIKFRRPGHPPEIEVTCEPAGGEWLIRVSDNGIGIGEKYADRVFVIFQQLHAREAYPGTGIGLAVCKKIVEFLGGRIWIDPEPATGATLCFTLPALSD